MRNLLTQSIYAAVTACVLTLVNGCETNNQSSAQPAPAAAQTSAPAKTTTPAQSIVRVDAGASAPFTDSGGHVWLADQGFDGGDTIERPDSAIANTQEPGLYQSEHYSMDSFSCKLANGKYLAKLHFAETFEGITGPGQRVFSFNVQGHEFKDFDVWVKAGGRESRLC